MFKPVIPSLALAAFVAAAPVAAQQQPAAGFEDLVEVTEVLLDVLATDRSGDVVTGLGKDDFVVTENGEPVAITGVSFYSTRYGSEDEPPPDEPDTPDEPADHHRPEECRHQE